MDEDNWWKRMAQQLSGVTVVIIIAGGVLTFVLLFIFAKRQIMRFTLRSHRGPHAPIGYDTNKALRREIVRRIDAIPKIIYEPKVLREEVEEFYTQNPDSEKKPCHYYRMKVVDEAKVLEMSMQKKKLGKRHTFESLRSYFIVILTPQVDPRVVHQLCDLYEAARFNPKSFGEEEYKAFSILLNQLRQAIQTIQPKSGSGTTGGGSMRSPAKTITTSSSRGGQKDKDNNKDTTTNQKQHLEEKMSAPYMRRLSKKERDKWGNDEESTALCHTNMHEVSIVGSKKHESTAV